MKSYNYNTIVIKFLNILFYQFNNGFFLHAIHIWRMPLVPHFRRLPCFHFLIIFRVVVVVIDQFSFEPFLKTTFPAFFSFQHQSPLPQRRRRRHTSSLGSLNDDDVQTRQETRWFKRNEPIASRRRKKRKRNDVDLSLSQSKSSRGERKKTERKRGKKIRVCVCIISPPRPPPPSSSSFAVSLPPSSSPPLLSFFVLPSLLINTHTYIYADLTGSDSKAEKRQGIYLQPKEREKYTKKRKAAVPGSLSRFVHAAVPGSQYTTQGFEGCFFPLSPSRKKLLSLSFSFFLLFFLSLSLLWLAYYYFSYWNIYIEAETWTISLLRWKLEQRKMKRWKRKQTKKLV